MTMLYLPNESLIKIEMKILSDKISTKMSSMEETGFNSPHCVLIIHSTLITFFQENYASVNNFIKNKYMVFNHLWRNLLPKIGVHKLNELIWQFAQIHWSAHFKFLNSNFTVNDPNSIQLLPKSVVS
jgi:hypothetical protein